MSGVTTRGKAAKAAQGAAVPSTSANTPTNLVPMDPDAEAQAAEQARLERLAKHETIKQAWQKRNKMVFRGAGQWGTLAMGHIGKWYIVNTTDTDGGPWGMGHMGNRAHGQ